MKKTLASILIALMLIVSVVPAFAAPVCPHEGCNGFLYKKTEEKRDGNWDYIVRTAEWDQQRDCWIYKYYLYTPMIKETYNVCNSSHRSLIKTEKYVKKEYHHTDDY